MAVKTLAEAEGKKVNVYDVGAMILVEAKTSEDLPANLRLPSSLKREDMTKDQLQVLIDIGKLRREQDHNYWLNRICIQAANDNPDVALCPNIRLPQEAEAIRRSGGFIVRYNRLNANGSPFISPDRDPNDITETAMNFWPADFYITTIADQAEWGRMQARNLYFYLTGRDIAERK